MRTKALTVDVQHTENKQYAKISKALLNIYTISYNQTQEEQKEDTNPNSTSLR